MRTISKVHSPEERLHQRGLAESRTAMCMVRLAAAVSMLRTIWTQLLPAAGSASWWLVPICFVPGLAVYAILCTLMKRTHTSVLSDLFRTAFGKAGGWIINLIIAVLLLSDGAASITALITLFTQGIGTEGTQFTLALLTAGALMCSLHREGLPRGIFLLRWLLLLSGVVLIAEMMGRGHTDHLFPLLGEGKNVTDARLSGRMEPFLASDSAFDGGGRCISPTRKTGFSAAAGMCPGDGGGLSVSAP